MSVEEDKARLRARVRSGRATRSHGDLTEARAGLAAALGSWPPFRRARSVAAFLAMPGEPDLGDALELLTERGCPVWLPITTRRDGEPWLSWAQLADGVAPGARMPSGVRIPEPIGARSDHPALDLVLVPGLAVDRTGHRLGQGGGYYDRTVQRLGWTRPEGPRLVSVVFDDEIFEEVPAEGFDTRVSAIVTPSGVREVQ